MKISKIVLPACAVAAILSACATKPPEDTALIQAREAVARLEADPLALQIAGKPLQEARDSLAAAEAAASDHKPMADVDYHAYMANRRAAVGEALVDENRATQHMAQAQARRDAVLIAAREHETDTARAQAALSQQQAAVSQQQAKDSQADAAAAAAQAQAAQAELAALQAKQTDRGMVLTLGNNLMFDTGSDVLKPGADDSLIRVGDFLKQHESVAVRVEGHTDSIGTDSYNDALSERRARAVAHALEDRGVATARVEAVGRGKELPVASNQTPEGRQQNRRVEIIFSDTQGQFVSSR